MYYEHYGLDAAPFKITPDTSQFYHGATRGDVLGAIEYAILNGEGIIKVVGEVGSGKTMLCRMLEVGLPDSVEIVYLANPSLSAEDTLHAIAFEMALPLPRDADRLKVMQVLQQALLEKHASNRQVVVFIEEAQRMPIDTLEEIRLLSNLETGQNKLLQMVLFGQPELDTNLSAKNIRQLKERITQSFYLSPFTVADIGEYLRFRMQNVGYRGPDVFTPEAIKIFARVSRGLARRINILADKALLAAYAQNTHTIERKHARLAIADSEFSRLNTGPDIKRWLIAAGVGAMVVLAGQFSLPYVAAIMQDDREHTQAIAAVPAGKSNVQTSLTAPKKNATIAEINIRVDQPPIKASVTTSAPGTVSEQDQQTMVSAIQPLAPALPEKPEMQDVTPLSNTGVQQVVPQFAGQNKNTTLTKQRLSATYAWLQQAEAGHYSIQIMMLERNEAKRGLEKFLQRADMRLRLQNVFIYNTNIRGTPMTGVAFGEYKNYKLAIKALNDLPDFLKKHGPHLRTVKGLRQDMET